MRLLRTLPTRSLLLAIAGVAALGIAGTVIAVASGSGGATPPPQPLASAVHDALASPAPAGITARVRFTNNLLPSGALFGNAGSALLSGASGRMWLRNDGRGRIELQSDAGDAQIVWSKDALTVYDASSDTVYKAALPASRTDSSSSPPTVAAISEFLTKLGEHLLVSGATPALVAGQPAYRVSVSPKRAGSLVGSVGLAWDATHGVPLRVSVNAKSSSAPALELAVTSIAYGSVPAADVDVSPPAGAKVVELGTFGGSGRSGQGTKPVSGLDAVRAAAGFDVAAPDVLAGRPRGEVSLHGKQVMLVYGQGPASIVLGERKAGAAHEGGPFAALPKVSIGGAAGHELRTELATVIAWQKGGVAYVLGGSVSAAVAETAARSVA